MRGRDGDVFGMGGEADGGGEGEWGKFEKIATLHSGKHPSRIGLQVENWSDWLGYFEGLGWGYGGWVGSTVA